MEEFNFLLNYQSPEYALNTNRIISVKANDEETAAIMLYRKLSTSDKFSYYLEDWDKESFLNRLLSQDGLSSGNGLSVELVFKDDIKLLR